MDLSHDATNSQFGFFKSWIHPTNLINNSQVDLAYLDNKKVFKSVAHDKLLYKLMFWNHRQSMVVVLCLPNKQLEFSVFLLMVYRVFDFSSGCFWYSARIHPRSTYVFDFC